MLYFPFIYFTTLLLAVIRKRGFDMSAYMIFIYAISSFFSIILYNQNYDYDLVYFSKIDISPLPTIIYCGLITFCIYPFYKYNSNRLKRKNKAILDFKILPSIHDFLLLVILIKYKQYCSSQKFDFFQRSDIYIYIGIYSYNFTFLRSNRI